MSSQEAATAEVSNFSVISGSAGTTRVWAIAKQVPARQHDSEDLERARLGGAPAHCRGSIARAITTRWISWVPS